MQIADGEATPATGLSSELASVAPERRVRMKAAQNRKVRGDSGHEVEPGENGEHPGDQKRAAVVTQAGASAIQSPSAVPSVCENMIVVQ